VSGDGDGGGGVVVSGVAMLGSPDVRLSTYTLRVLHLSDLHERVAPKTAGPARDRKVRAHKAKQARVLGDELMEQLDKIVAAGAVDLLFFTGDLADWGLDGEYDLAKTRLGEIVSAGGPHLGAGVLCARQP
jgi:hypothetical protein